MILGVAMQFIPVLGEEAETIRMAQTARGLGLKVKADRACGELSAAGHTGVSGGVSSGG
ncbi:MAG: hypothetical protein ACLURV_05700 [Gallintestinimicrobium sp.]